MSILIDYWNKNCKFEITVLVLVYLESFYKMYYFLKILIKHMVSLRIKNKSLVWFIYW